jgi:nickel-dependent lactate racemase
MNATLDFGKTGLKITIPDGNFFSLLELSAEPAIANPSAVLRKNLFDPIGCVPFPDLCRGKKSACIVVSDKTRPVPNAVILPPLLEILDAMKIRTTILVACGMHSPTSGADLDELVGPRVVSKYEIVNHNGDDGNNLVELDRSRDGHPVSINRRYVEADLRVCTGFIEPHFMAGFSGGRKAVCPGICGTETMRHAHGAELMGSPLAATGILEGNPFHEFALEVAKMAGVDFIVNVTLDRDKKITGIFTGDLEKAHRDGATFCRRQAAVSMPEEADIVVTSNGGHPLDQDFYQTVKGMVSALPAVKPGGTVIIASECKKGLGSADFRDMLHSMKTPDSFNDMINEPGFFRVDQWEVQQLAKALAKVKVKVVCSCIDAADLRRCHVEPADSVEQAVTESIREYGPGAKITVIPSGPYVIPRVERP